MLFGIICRTGPGIKQVVGFEVGPRKRYFGGSNLGGAIVTNGDFTAYVCATVPQPSELRFGVVRPVGRGIAVLHGGPRRTRGRDWVSGVFCSPFS